MRVRVKNTDKCGRTLFLPRRLDHGKDCEVEYTSSIEKMINDGVLFLLTPHEEEFLPTDSAIELVKESVEVLKESTEALIEEIKAEEIVQPEIEEVIELIEPEVVESTEPEIESTDSSDGSIKQKRRRKSK